MQNFNSVNLMSMAAVRLLFEHQPTLASPSTAKSQAENPLLLEDLCQAAFDQRDEKERVILQQGIISALTRLPYSHSN